MKYHHTSISVNNLEESRKFYEDIFDMQLDSEAEREDLQIKIVNLKNKNGGIIELFKHKNSLPLKEDLMDFQKVGIKHLAFAVDDIEKTIKKAMSLGSKLLWPIQEGITIKRLAFISDPNNIPIELMELKDEKY